VIEVARQLVVKPDLQGLTPRQLRQIVNWKISGLQSQTEFSVVDKTVPELQDAMTRGVATSEDLVREYLTRLTTYDRNGPTFRSMLSINPMVYAAARVSDDERSVGRVRSPLHGVPVAFKDNIDATDLPTTGGSRALAEHRSTIDSHIVAGMRQAGAIVLGKTNLDEFPFGDFGISTVGGTVGNAYDPTLSTAGSSGGSATAVSTSLVALGFGTDTCNSLSNPSSFASLSTIRTTRGLTSRAGVMPLNTYNDAVGPMAKSVKELALVLDQVTGTDPEDPATKDADRHRGEPFATRLGATNLKGARLGFLRQRFVGLTGEQEAAGLMERVKSELEASGATVVDVRIPDLDEAYRKARGSAPGSLKSAWNAYLARGVKPGVRPQTIDDLLASGKLAPESASVFENANKPAPMGEELRLATDRFYAGRDAFRALFEKAMDDQRLDGLVYPGNLARPHTHEGGLERYGSEPGTCEESAMTGLPQVTVPGGFLGDRYPFGVSFLGRLWADQRMLDLAYAYEQATHHRHPPVIAQ
jgi:Asp-tRNA(Asn)/Glu-tRNA(Gln) amidotransferase A subunit family amidase